MARELRAQELLAALVIVMIVVAGLAYWSATPAAAQGLVQFRSYGEYEAFLDRTGYYEGGGAAMFGDGRLAGLMAGGGGGRRGGAAQRCGGTAGSEDSGRARGRPPGRTCRSPAWTSSTS